MSKSFRNYELALAQKLDPARFRTRKVDSEHMKKRKNRKRIKKFWQTECQDVD